MSYLDFALTKDDLAKLKASGAIEVKRRNCIERSLTEAERTALIRPPAMLQDLALALSERAKLTKLGIIQVVKPRRGRPPKPKRDWRVDGMNFRMKTLLCEKCFSVVKRLTANQKYCTTCGPKVQKQHQRDWRYKMKNIKAEESK